MPRKIYVLFFFMQLIPVSIIQCESNISQDSIILLGKNPITDSLLTILRDKSTNYNDFQEATNELANFLVLETGKFIPTEKNEVQTPTMAVFKDGVKLKKNPILVPILRGGLSLLPVFQRFFKGASIGMIGHKRNEETAEPMLYYLNLPFIQHDDTIIILEPMLATGGSLSLAISLLKRAGANEANIIIATVIGAPPGVERLLKEFPEIHIVMAALDTKLNEKFYIVPGLGDFGDRYFGNDNKPDFEILKIKA